MHSGGVPGFAQRGPAESLIIFVVEVGYQVDTRVRQVPSLSRLRVVVGVRHDLVRAADKPPHAILQVIEAHGVMARVAAGWLQSHPGG